MSQQPKVFPELSKRFVRESGRCRTPKSTETFEQVLRQLQSKHQTKGVADFKLQHLTEFCLHGNVAPATIANRRSILSTFFGWCKYQGIIKDDPSADLKWTVKPGKFSVRQNTWLTGAEIRQLLKTMPTDTVMERRDRALVATGLLTGLRLEGLIGLRWTSFSPDMMDVKLLTKGNKIFQTSVPDDLHVILTAWRAEMGSCQGHQDDSPVFPSFRFGPDNVMVLYPHVPLQERGARNAVAKAGKLIGVTLRPHDLRRSGANLLEEEGFSPREIQDWLGHENLATTSHYLNKNPNRTLAIGRRIKL